MSQKVACVIPHALAGTSQLHLNLTEELSEGPVGGSGLGCRLRTISIKTANADLDLSRS